MAVPFSAVKAAAGFNNDEIAAACGLAKATIDQCRTEKKSGEWKLRELRAYYHGINDDAKELLLQAVADFVCS
ncbi:hypothetical protein [Senegalimassilia anaerobia]|uniref:hypothetical protein n=1 Tax=Senegalimassilia anaerobia TaxID=1473216 RepID=UPI0026735CD2|nr:hypothetical protein [Senegalimassilia anaerobia]